MKRPRTRRPAPAARAQHAAPEAPFTEEKAAEEASESASSPAAPKPPVPKRRWARKLLLLAGAVVFAAALAEAVLRVKVCCNAHSFRPLLSRVVECQEINRDDSNRSHALTEGMPFVATGYPPGMEFCAYGQISEQGLNDEFVPPEKPADEYRVLFLGDSFVEARQVRRKANVCERLEVMLNQAALGRKIRVINAGVSSFCPLLEFIYYRNELARFKADIVVQVFFANDVFDDCRYSTISTFDNEGRPLACPEKDAWIGFEGDNMKPEQQMAVRGLLVGARDARPPQIASYSYVASTIFFGAATLKILANAEQSKPINPQFFILDRNPKYDKAKEQGWAIAGRNLGFLKEECAKNGARMMMSATPIASQVYGKSSYDRFFFFGEPTEDDQVEIKKIAGNIGVPFVDLLGPMRAGGKGLYFPRDGHWTEAGHLCAAKALFPKVREMIAEDLKRSGQ